MDTGAKSSSINAYNLHRFQRGDEMWVSFELKEKSNKNKGKSVIFEKNVISLVKIKLKGGGVEERVVVKLDVCISGVYKEVEMSLVDRSNFNYQVLIGRADLENVFVVDPSATFTHKPVCKVPVEMTP